MVCPYNWLANRLEHIGIALPACRRISDLDDEKVSERYTSSVMGHVPVRRTDCQSYYPCPRQRTRHRCLAAATAIVVPRPGRVDDIPCIGTDGCGSSFGGARVEDNSAVV